MTCCRMNDHSLRLIDYKKIRILVDYIKRDILRNEGIVLFGFGNIRFNDISGGKLGAGLGDDLTVD